jgi:peptidoglycan/xylan/chitin deacetylase (PgdA/CDA1 family)
MKRGAIYGWGLVVCVALAALAGFALARHAEEATGAAESPDGAAGEAVPVVDRRMAVTFDDLPVGSVVHPDVAGQRAILEPLITAVTAHRVPAIGFVNESKLYADGELDPARVALLEGWLDAGLDLGNHTYSHPDLHHTPLADFEADVERGSVVTRRLLAARGEELRWFRHPFLHTGRDLETKRGLVAFLAEHGQRVAPVTVDHDDYLFAAAWDRAGARGDHVLQRRLEDAYVPYIESKVAYYEGQSRALFGREIPQVLLLHANSINARRFADLAQALTDRGYRFIPLATAVADPAYTSEDTYTGPAGISWLHRWAITRNVDRQIFQGEPETPAWVQRAARPD